MNLLTTRELAEYLGLSPATVLRRWRRGEIPGYRLASNVVRFDRDEIDRWLAGRRNGPDAGGKCHPSHRGSGPRGVLSGLSPVPNEEDHYAR